MKVIDSVYINDGGGYILLEYFISQAKAQGFHFYYLIDVRLKSKIRILGLESEQYIIIKNSEFSRLKFYLSNRGRISAVCTFGNVPPPIRLKCRVYTIFHNLLMLRNDHLPFFKQMKYFLKKIYISLLGRNTDFWIIQSTETQNELLNQNWINPNQLIIAPFWKTSKFKYETTKSRKNLSFFYPCSLAEHKNLRRLLMAWEKAFYINDKITLYLTIPDSWFTKNKIIAANINVLPLGTLDYPLLMEWYQNCEYVLFPSYCESFGLPLIEGIENGCKIVASDLPFTHSIIDPFAVFDPYSVDSIKDAIINIAAQQEPSKFGKNKINIENKIIQILSMIYYGKI